VSRASLINLGVVSYDVLIPSSAEFPGVDILDISNLTGDLSTGGFALPPDFPSLSSVIFRNSTLTLFTGSSHQVILLGDIGPGFFSSDALQFADTVAFSSAAFAATLDPTCLLVSDGTTFVATSSLINVALTPSSGPFLEAGRDFALITVANVPEPASWLLVASGCVAVWRRARRSPFRP
jgi:hypothetical protein